KKLIIWTNLCEEKVSIISCKFTKTNNIPMFWYTILMESRHMMNRLAVTVFTALALFLFLFAAAWLYHTQLQRDRVQLQAPNQNDIEILEIQYEESPQHMNRPFLPREYIRIKKREVDA